MEGIQWGEGHRRAGLRSSAGAAGEGDRIQELHNGQDRIITCMCYYATSPALVYVMSQAQIISAISVPNVS